MYLKYEHYKKKINKKKILKDILFVYLIAIIFVLLFNSFIMQAFFVPSNSMEPHIPENTRILVNKFIFGPKYPFTEKRIFDATKNIRRGDVIVFMSQGYFKKNTLFKVISTLTYTLSFSAIELSRMLDGSKTNIYIKRVIGIPGDVIKYKLLDNKVVVFINNIQEKKTINTEYYLIEENEKNSKLISKMILQNEHKVTEKEYYVLGDNRISSADSRIWGSVSSGQIIGKAIVKYWHWPFSLSKLGVIK